MRGKVTCYECGEQHVAEFSHVSQFGQDRCFAVVCPRDNLTAFYTEEVVVPDSTTTKESTMNNLPTNTRKCDNCSSRTTVVVHPVGEDCPELLQLVTCDWFALCPKRAVGLLVHPVIGAVPACEDCREFAEQEWDALLVTMHDFVWVWSRGRGSIDAHNFDGTLSDVNVNVWDYVNDQPTIPFTHEAMRAAVAEGSPYGAGE